MEKSGRKLKKCLHYRVDKGKKKIRVSFPTVPVYCPTKATPESVLLSDPFLILNNACTDTQADQSTVVIIKKSGEFWKMMFLYQLPLHK